MNVSMELARKAAGLSQTDLAREMKAHGFPTWSQTTVSRRERDESNITWNEGVALRKIIAWPLVPDMAEVVEHEMLADALAYRRMAEIVSERMGVAS